MLYPLHVNQFILFSPISNYKAEGKKCGTWIQMITILKKWIKLMYYDHYAYYGMNNILCIHVQQAMYSKIKEQKMQNV